MSTSGLATTEVRFTKLRRVGSCLAPSPLYSGERGGVRGHFESCVSRQMTALAPHLNPLPRVEYRGEGAGGRAALTSNRRYAVLAQSCSSCSTFDLWFALNIAINAMTPIPHAI